MDQIIFQEVYLNGTLVESALRMSLNNVFAKTAYDNMLVINDVLNYHGYEFEKMDISFHERLRVGFLDIAEKNKDRCIVIDAMRPIDVIQKDLQEIVRNRLLS